MSTASPQAIPVNEDKMNAFLGKVVGDFGAALPGKGNGGTARRGTHAAARPAPP